MRVFMFSVMVLLAVLAIGCAVAAVALFANANVLGGFIAVIGAGAFTIMANSIGKSLRELN